MHFEVFVSSLINSHVDLIVIITLHVVVSRALGYTPSVVHLASD